LAIIITHVTKLTSSFSETSSTKYLIVSGVSQNGQCFVLHVNRCINFIRGDISLRGTTESYIQIKFTTRPSPNIHRLLHMYKFTVLPLVAWRSDDRY